jgi:xanthine dehydrogenase accessory factor
MKARPVHIEAQFFRRVAERMAEREPLVLVTVAASTGSAPGKAGAKMAVARDGQEGTIGGGKVERAALARAREILAVARDSHRETAPSSQVLDVVRDLGMTCGGTMTLLFEPLVPPPRLVLFGAGHVAEALCAVAARAGFDVQVCDELEDRLTAGRFPDARDRIVGPYETSVSQAGLDAASFVAVASPGHASDERIALAILTGVEPRYLGVIGSRRKAVEFRKALEARGVPAERATKIRIPMGLDIGAAEPREIAVSVVAEMIAVLRGADGGRRW